MATTLNASTSNGLIQTADTSGVLALQAADTTIASVSSTGVAVTGAITATGQIAAIKSATSQASTSGTSIDFTSIPAGVKRITIIFGGVSLSGTANYLVQVGSGSVTATGYSSASNFAYSSAGGSASSTTGFIAFCNNAAYVYSGLITLVNITGNSWVCNHTLGNLPTNIASIAGGGYMTAALSGALDRVRITTSNGTDTFDAGSINIFYE